MRYSADFCYHDVSEGRRYKVNVRQIAEQLDSIFKLKKFRTISLTGGGGKTSMLYALGGYFAVEEKVVMTTTTKIYRPEESDHVQVFIASLPECIEEIKNTENYSLSLAAKREEEQKLIGFTPEETDTIAASEVCGKLIVEADGTRGMSFKCYENWEPPVPQSSNCQIIILGADTLVSPASPTTVFRLDMLREKYGIQKGEMISARNMAAILSNKSEYLKNSPKETFRILFINKGELLEEEERENTLRKIWENLNGYDGAAIGSLSEDRIYASVIKDSE